ncbi:MAG: noncanonical pyrimidine nucleotidase, YjjG family [Saprospiraceae bacterium]|nr:noncanonical pyrimidine nucleotidase, YjjG family [Saprospiraceae bacterium]
MSAFRYLLFDLDETLLNFGEASRNAFQLFFEQYLSHQGLNPQTLSAHYHDANMTVWEMFEQGQMSIDELKVKRFEWMYLHAGLSIPYDQLDEQSHYYLDALIQSSQMIRGAKEIIESLAADYHLNVITNGIYFVQHARLDKLKLKPYFQNLFISEEIGHSKPSPQFFDHVLKTLVGAQTNEILVIGDSLKADIKGALQSGLKACWFNPGGITNETDITPHFEIKTWEEFHKILQ